jgi:hypothetical protein
MSITSPDHFVASEAVPTISSEFPLRQVYSTLATRNSSGFVLTRNNIPVKYVKAGELGSVILRDWGSALAEYTDMPIGDIVTQLESSGAIVPVRADVDASGDANLLFSPVQEVFPVTREGRNIGWFLNHEILRATATGRTVWICANPGNPHENADPDSGTCHYCPFGFARVEQR